MSNVVDIFGAQKTELPRHGMDWLVFQISESGADDSWISVHPDDLPPWVLKPEVVLELRDGRMVNGAPERGRLWFRALVVDAPEKTEW